MQQFARETGLLTRLLAPSRLEPVLGLELTLQQLRIVLLVATGIAVTGRSLADLLHVSPATMSVSVDKLVELGYLVRDDAPSDRRVKHLSVTGKAAEVYDQFLNKREAPDELVASLSTDDLAALVRGVSALRAAAERRADSRPE